MPEKDKIDFVKATQLIMKGLTSSFNGAPSLFFLFSCTCSGWKWGDHSIFLLKLASIFCYMNHVINPNFYVTCHMKCVYCFNSAHAHLIKLADFSIQDCNHST